MEEGLRLELYFKKSTLFGVPDKLYMNLFVDGALCFCLHENGPAEHLNKIGIGMPHYQKQIGHPHMHTPVGDGTYGYAEPVERTPIGNLWCLFLERANILEAPQLTLPDKMQGVLDL